MLLNFSKRNLEMMILLGPFQHNSMILWFCDVVPLEVGRKNNTLYIHFYILMKTQMVETFNLLI